MTRKPFTVVSASDEAPDAVLLGEAHYWDAVVRGDLSRAGVVDPSIAATIARIHALDAAPLPDAEFAARLEADLMAAQPVFPPSLLAIPSALSMVEDAQNRVSTKRSRLAWRGAGSAFATAALVLLTVLASIAAIGSARLAPDAQRRSVQSPLSSSDLLLQGPVAMPENVLWAGVTRYILEPGAALALNGNGETYEAAALYRVESGALTIQPQGPTTITPAGDSQSGQPVQPGTEHVLTVGDQGATPFGVALRWHNAGDAPVTVLAAGVTTGGNPPTTPGIVKYTIIDEMPFYPPADRVLMSVARITLPPEAILTTDAIPGLEMLRVETGHLVAVDREGTPLNARAVSWATRTLGTFPPGRAFGSGDGQPVTLLMVTLTGANPLRPGG